LSTETAGPLFVSNGASAIADVDDPEGFAATCHEFDQDLTAEREPRLALGLRADEWLAVAVDGRSPDEAGMVAGVRSHQRQSIVVGVNDDANRLLDSQQRSWNRGRHDGSVALLLSA
jgi:hypothetical protein